MMNANELDYATRKAIDVCNSHKEHFIAKFIEQTGACVADCELVENRDWQNGRIVYTIQLKDSAKPKTPDVTVNVPMDDENISRKVLTQLADRSEDVHDFTITRNDDYHNTEEYRVRLSTKKYLLPADREKENVRAILREQVRKVIEQARGEVFQASQNWPPFNSAHEGYAVLLEEVEELWEQVKINQTKRDLDKMRKEAIQVAAMAIRFVVNVIDQGRGRN